MTNDVVAIDLLDFLRTGIFDPVQWGISRAELQELLGPADDFSIPWRRERYPTIFKYGDFEFYVDPKQDRLYAIHSDNFSIPRGNDQLHLHTHGINSETSLSQMKDLLSRAGVKYSEQIDGFGEIRIVTEGYVTLAFNDESTEPAGGLAAISRSNYDVLVRDEPT